MRLVQGLENNFRGQASYLECSLSAKISKGWAQTNMRRDRNKLELSFGVKYGN